MSHYFDDYEMASSSVLVPQLMKDEEPMNWAELPHELTSSILFRLDVDEILLTAQSVCRSWRRVCKHPSMWWKVDMRSSIRRFSDRELDSLCRQVVDLSQRGLLEIMIRDFGSDDLLSYIANRLTDTGLNSILDNLPYLNYLDLRGCFNINLVGNLEKRCLERVKELIRPEEKVDESSADFRTDLLYVDLEF